MMSDLADIAKEMEDVADTASSTGLDMDEYTEYGFPETHRCRIARAMTDWETGCYYLHEAAEKMAKFAAEIEGVDDDV